MNMSNVVTKAIEAALAVNETGISNEAVAAAVSRAKAEKAEQLCKQLALVFQQAEQYVTIKVADLREYRKQEQRAKKALEDFVRRYEYAKATGNVAVLVRHCSAVYNVLTSVGIQFETEMETVPADWTPPTE
jgi:hypothetical protein